MKLSRLSIPAGDGQEIPVEIVVRPVRGGYRISISDKGARLSISRSISSDTGKILEKHAGWIWKHYSKLRESAIDSGLADGSHIPFKGAKCLLEITEGGNSISYDTERPVLRLSLTDTGLDNRRNRLCLWYLAQSANFAKILSGRWKAVERFGVRKIVLKDMSTRWGTCCRKNKVVTLNWRLILAPEEIYEYVFIHELAHFAVPGHGKKFWDCVETMLPGASVKRSWLNRNGYPLLRFLSENRLSPERIV